MSKSRPDVSKMTHGFFITVSSVILYFKHIIHIDDFPLNGHPPSGVYTRGSKIYHPSGKCITCHVTVREERL